MRTGPHFKQFQVSAFALTARTEYVFGTKELYFNNMVT